MCVGVDPCRCSRDGTVEKVTVLMLDMEAVCLPNMFLANEGGCEIDTTLIRDVRCHPIVWVNIR